MQTNKEMTGQQAYQKLSALCARSEHCQQEMLDKMRQWGVSEEEQAQVMARLIKEKYVDDSRFARAFVYDKIRYNKWGRRKVEQALWMKHIDESIGQQVLDEVDDKEYLQILRPMLRQKQRSIKGGSEYERSMKLIKFAIGRGFTMNLIRQCMEVNDENEFPD
ncbi:MAG: RecX family transcriptional regulator [Prevotella sp.]|nr:RecX family transcriptional regulator [Prevotella sp.]